MERMIRMLGIPEAVVERLKRKYPQGTRVELTQMQDPYRNIPARSKGTVIGVDDIGTIHVDWDCGISLGVAYGEDTCRKIKE